ncbi:restriction endonuclease [Edwardsiella hoshinae]|uniref:Restriction endonuclease n=1 Tax=Edwardsiella hoshinae TaxID=93378 RepID=A0ABM6EMD3_9GAMM|nr:antirestriction protein [Edwardsiella hoshinae]AOV98213.1 restriction endonuclease [Edwardsiella hoshinae]
MIHPHTPLTSANEVAEAQPQLSTIKATRGPDHQRLAFWPSHFGNIPQWIMLEPHIFSWMDRLCTDYRGGVWAFYTLSNGGAFMAPEDESHDESRWALFNPLNGNNATMSAEAAGITACLLAYSHHACRTESDAMSEHYYRLRDYAFSHPECDAILSIID